MSAIVLDTETTGITDPEVIQLAYVGPLSTFEVAGQPITCTRFKPSKPISIGALATHHILESDLAGFPPWPGSWILPAEVDCIVGHKVDFDWEAIGKPNVARICTLALARSLWPDLDSHSLGALTYHFNDHRVARALLRDAHDAMQDVALCSRLLIHILTALPAVQTWNDLWEASERARVPERLTFGKYGTGSDWAKTNNQGRGILCARVREYDRGYWEWLMSKCDQVREDPYLRKALSGDSIS